MCCCLQTDKQHCTAFKMGVNVPSVRLKESQNFENWSHVHHIVVPTSVTKGCRIMESIGLENDLKNPFLLWDTISAAVSSIIPIPSSKLYLLHTKLIRKHEYLVFERLNDGESPRHKITPATTRKIEFIQKEDSTWILHCDKLPPNWINFMNQFCECLIHNFTKELKGRC